VTAFGSGVAIAIECPAEQEISEVAEGTVSGVVGLGIFTASGSQIKRELRSAEGKAV
jgi:hypothetical protein